MQFNIPTLLTLFRFIIAPFFILAFYLPFKWGPLCCALIFILASLTDWFDGFLARRWKQSTRFGAFLDPVADKVIVVMALVLVAEHFHSWWITLPSIIIITREIIISALREWMAEIGKRNNVAVSWISKIKTTTQMISLISLLWRPNKIILIIGITALYIAVILTFWSMSKHIDAARQDLFKKKLNNFDCK